MHDKLSFKSEAGPLAREMQALVQKASGSIEPGDSIKTQINRAHRNLGRPAYWRVRAAWYGEAENWSASVVDDLRQRLKIYQDKVASANDARNLSDTKEIIAMRTRLGKLRHALTQADADFYSQEIDALSWVLSLNRN